MTDMASPSISMEVNPLPGGRVARGLNGSVGEDILTEQR